MSKVTSRLREIFVRTRWSGSISVLLLDYYCRYQNMFCLIHLVYHLTVWIIRHVPGTCYVGMIYIMPVPPRALRDVVRFKLR